MKNALIQGMIINLILLIIFSWIFFFKILPEYSVVNNKKSNLRELVQNFESLEANGISFTDLRKIANSYKLLSDDIASQSLDNFTKNDYDSFFTNTGTLSYNDFLSQAEERVTEKMNDPEFLANIDLVNTILPVYTPNNSNISWVNDFYFVNYLERLLYSFNLQSDGEVGISSIQSVFDESEVESYTESIYKIPLSLSLEWRKSDIVKFLHFLENVWSLQYSESEVEVINDDFLNLALEGQESTPSYNIYENQLANITQVTFSDYPDSWSVISEESLVDTLILRQWRERYSMEINLEFYISGLPKFEIKEYIDSFIIRFDTLKKEILDSNSSFAASNRQFQWNELNVRNSLQSLELVMVSFEEEILPYRWINLQDITEDDNESVQTYESKLSKIEESYRSAIKLLNQE